MQRCTLHFDGVRCADFQTPTSVVPVLGAFSYPTMTITLADTVMIILTSILDLAVCQIFPVVVSSVGSDPDVCSNITNTHTNLYTSEIVNNYDLI